MLRKDPFITGEYYHLYNRGIDKRIILKTKKDYERFMMLLYVANSNNDKPLRLDNLINILHKNFNEVMVLDKGRSLVSIGAWCLMPNHFHLLIRQEVDGGITKFMKKLGTGYSMFFNIKYQRQGALFGGPFKSKLIGVNDNYMRQLFGYVHINPLEIEFPEWKNRLNMSSDEMKLARTVLASSKMKKFLESYRYSSYQDYMGVNRVEKNILNRKNFPDYFVENYLD